MKRKFLNRLEEGTILMDGAMGTMLYSKGIYINRCFDELNLSASSLVQGIYEEYLIAGAEILTTNTFGANYLKLRPHGFEGKIREINREGARLAKEIARGRAFVAGSIGPLGVRIAPLGNFSIEEAKEIFTKQILGLLEGRVDLFVLETFSDINEIKQLIKTIRSICQLPIIAQMTINEQGNTLLGATPETIAEELDKIGVEVMGINCSVGPQPILQSLVRMSKMTKTKLSAEPDAGAFKIIDERIFYLSTPEYFAEYTKRFIQSGITLIGGCCGTTPAHIKAMASAMRALQPSKTEIVIITPEDEHLDKNGKTIQPIPRAEKSKFAAKLVAGKFVTCVEMSPPRGANPARALKGAKLLKENNVDVVNIPDGPRASARMSPMALATLLLNKVGIEPLVHYCTRDRNLLGMQSDLLGAHALGLHNILIITGDPPKLGNYPNATAVFDVDSIGLVRIVHNLNRGLDLAGNYIKSATALHIGVGANPGAIDIEKEIDRLYQKVDNGAEYILTQPLFEMELFINFLERTKDIKVPLLVGILPLASYHNAEFLHNEVPGMSIPKHIRERIRKAPDSKAQKQIGIEIAREALTQFKDLVQGVYVMPPFGSYKAALKVLEVVKDKI